MLNRNTPGSYLLALRYCCQLATFYFFGIIWRPGFCSFRNFCKTRPAASQIFCKGCHLQVSVIHDPDPTILKTPPLRPLPTTLRSYDAIHAPTTLRQRKCYFSPSTILFNELHFPVRLFSRTIHFARAKI